MSGSLSTWSRTCSRPAPSSTWPATSSPAPGWPGWPAPSTGKVRPTFSGCRVAGGPRAGPLRPQQDPDHRKATDLSRLSKVHGAGFDCAFLKVMLARHRTGLGMAAVEARDGTIAELRALARRMMTELQAQLEQMMVLLGA